MKRILSFLLTGVICLSLAACGKTAAPGESTAVQPTQTQAPATQAAAEPSEANTLSGKVAVYMPSPAGLADKLAAGFTAATGAEVEQFQGTTGEILARLEAEEANPVADVVILASWSDGLSMKQDGKLMSYKPANAERIVDGWIDDDAMLFGYSASAVGFIYSTTVIPELSADWSELVMPSTATSWQFRIQRNPVPARILWQAM